MDHAVPDRLQRKAFQVELGRHPVQGRGVVGYRRFADPFHQPAGDRPGAVEQPVLQRGRAGVQDEDHDPAAWTAVIAMVFTMSRTVAPRDRSLTGLRRPCRTGPTATAWAERCTAL